MLRLKPDMRFLPVTVAIFRNNNVGIHTLWGRCSYFQLQPQQPSLYKGATVECGQNTDCYCGPAAETLTGDGSSCRRRLPVCTFEGHSWPDARAKNPMATTAAALRCGWAPSAARRHWGSNSCHEFSPPRKFEDSGNECVCVCVSRGGMVTWRLAPRCVFVS